MSYETLANKARNTLEKMLVFGELNFNVLYSENKLSAMLNLGRTPIREAIQSLEKDNLLIIHPRKGIEFIQITSEQQLQLLEVRRQIEPICLKFAIMRATTTQKKQMHALAEKIALCGKNHDQTGMLYCLQEIHDLILESTQNPYFAHALRQIQYFSRRFWFENKNNKEDVMATKYHTHILKAVACGNEKVALHFSGLLMEHLIETTIRNMPE